MWSSLGVSVDTPTASLPSDYYRRAVACCDDRPPIEVSGACPSCGDPMSPELREALYRCGHGNEIRAFVDSPEVACVDCGLRFCKAVACENVAVRAGALVGWFVACGRHSEPLAGLDGRSALPALIELRPLVQDFASKICQAADSSDVNDQKATDDAAVEAAAALRDMLGITCSRADHEHARPTFADLVRDHLIRMNESEDGIIELVCPADVDLRRHHIKERGWLDEPQLFEPNEAETAAGDVDVTFTVTMWTLPTTGGHGRRVPHCTAVDVLRAIATTAATWERARNYEEWARKVGAATEANVEDELAEGHRAYAAVQDQTLRLRDWLGDEYGTYVWGARD